VYVDVHLYKIFAARRNLALTASVKFRIGSPKAARNEQACAHQKSYRRYIFQNPFSAAVYRMDSSCAPMLRIFSMASDGATTERQL